MGNGDQQNGFNLDDADRLPWLEPAEDYGADEGVSVAKIVGLVLLGLLLLGVIVGGGYWLKTREGGEGDARLIAAQEGDYKVSATADGKSFEGEGDTSYATSEGVDTDGKVDASRVPEAPMAGVSRGSISRDDASKAAGQPAARVSAPVKDQTKAKAANAGGGSAATPGAAMIQLGAYGSEAVAKEGWTKLSKRFDYLAALSHRIEKAEVGGATVYRLRAEAGTAADAANLCGRLKVAGESCIVVR